MALFLGFLDFLGFLGLLGFLGFLSNNRKALAPLGPGPRPLRVAPSQGRQLQQVSAGALDRIVFLRFCEHTSMP